MISVEIGHPDTDPSRGQTPAHALAHRPVTTGRCRADRGGVQWTWHSHRERSPSVTKCRVHPRQYSDRPSDRMRLGYSPRKEDPIRWQRILNKKGWAAHSSPVEHGGPGWSAIQRMIFLQEVQSLPAPETLSFNITMIGRY